VKNADRGRSISKDGSGLCIGLAASRYNESIVGELVESTRRELSQLGVAEVDISEYWTPGAFELPLVVKTMLEAGHLDAVVCLGCVIRGETPHFDFVAGETAAGIMRVGLEQNVPVIFGVLTTETMDQAIERTKDRGAEFANTAVEMVQLLDSIRSI
tara:strand:+ start:282 stop:752 length:471 start_codon:yes stop_codon:yes gene_type:complete